MVLAAVVLDTKAAARLSRRGLRDSKTFGAGDKGRQTRAELAAEVRELALFCTVEVVDVSEIDRRVTRGELNVLEREVARRMIARAPAVDRIVADGKRLFAQLQDEHDHLEALDRGESRHASVAAASVLAKHRRDCLFECIARRYHAQFGEVRGGGYGNAATREFLRAYAEEVGGLPPEARRSWPYPYLGDILGPDFDPFGDCDGEGRSQLSLAL
jgi:ribonuclease HII